MSPLSVIFIRRCLAVEPLFSMMSEQWASAGSTTRIATEKRRKWDKVMTEDSDAEQNAAPWNRFLVETQKICVTKLS